MHTVEKGVGESAKGWTEGSHCSLVGLGKDWRLGGNEGFLPKL